MDTPVRLQKEKQRLWTKDYIVLLFLVFFVHISHPTLSSIIPIYIESIDGSMSVAGITTSIFAVFSMAVRPMAGSLLDKFRRKTIMLIGMVLLMLSIVFCTAFTFILVILFLRAVQGIGYSLGTTALGTISNDIMPKSYLAEGITVYSIVQVFGMAIGPTIGLSILAKTNYNMVFYYLTLCIALAIFLSFFMNEGKRPDDSSKKNTSEIISMEDDSAKSGFIWKYFEKSALWPSIVKFMTGFPHSSRTIYLAMYAMTKGIENIGFYFSIMSFTAVIVRTIGKRLYDKCSYNTLLVFVFIFHMISFVILIFADSVFLFVLSALFCGLGSMDVPVLNTMAILNVPEPRRGAANATFLMCGNDLSFILGAVVWGVAADYLGFNSVFVLSAISIAVSFVIFLIVTWKHKSVSV